MKKNNWIILTLALIACVALLAVYFILGFNHIHALDIVLAIIWVMMIVAAAIAFRVTGKKGADGRSSKRHRRPERSL